MGAIHCIRRRGLGPHKPWRSYERLWKRAQMQGPKTSMGAVHYRRHYPRDAGMLQSSFVGIPQYPHNLDLASSQDTILLCCYWLYMYYI